MLQRRRPLSALPGLLQSRDCVDCPSTNPSCPTCSSNEQCVITSRVCDACPSATCVKNGSSSSGGGGISGGAVAGAVIGVLLLLSAAVALFLWYRRRQRAEKAAAPAPAVEPKSDVPARAEAVLSRPDPNEKPASPREEGSASSSVVRMYPVMSDSTINLDPHAHVLYSDDSPDGSRIRSSRHGSYTGGTANPFSDGNSIITTSASTQSTNVIPIALVPHGASSPGQSGGSRQQTDDERSTTASTTTTSSTSSGSSGAPARPAHSPELGLRFDPHALSHGHGHLNLEHVNVSKDSFRPPHAPYASSQASGFSNRESVMTSGSFASDMLYEAPQIVTLTNTSRAKAEVVSVNGSVSSNLKPSMSLRQQPGRSPLAQSSFKPSDAFSVSERSSTHSHSVEDGSGQEIEYSRHNPFDDGATPQTGSSFSNSNVQTPNPVPSTASLAMHGGKDRDIEAADSPRTPRPMSTLTQAASIIGAEIGGATVVRLAGSSGPLGSANSANRLTSAHLLSPGLSSGSINGTPLGTGMSGTINSAMSGNGVGQDRTLQLQQAQALAAARAKAAAQGITSSSSSSSSSPKSGNVNANGIHSRRVSEASCMSTGGDSLLESFTFVPPSPISSRPPRSPLSSSSSASSPLSTSISSIATSPVAASKAATAALPPVPKLPEELARANEASMEANAGEVESRRKMLGMSTGTTASNALEGYEFRIEEMNTNVAPVPAPVRTTGLRKLPPSPARPPPSAGAGAGQTVAGRQRASLDTLALTSDLAAFPLSFDANGQRRV